MSDFKNKKDEEDEERQEDEQEENVDVEEDDEEEDDDEEELTMKALMEGKYVRYCSVLFLFSFCSVIEF
jgi:hypothetical protein